MRRYSWGPSDRQLLLVNFASIRFLENDMKNIHLALVRGLQFVVFVLFTCIVLFYFGTLILLPLDLVVLIAKFLHLFGI